MGEIDFTLGQSFIMIEAIKQDYVNVVSELTKVSKEEILYRISKAESDMREKLEAENPGKKF